MLQNVGFLNSRVQSDRHQLFWQDLFNFLVDKIRFGSLSQFSVSLGKQLTQNYVYHVTGHWDSITEKDCNMKTDETKTVSMFARQISTIC